MADGNLEISWPRLTALVVEDQAAMRRTIKDFLRRLGARVQEASDGTEAWEALQEQDFDFIIADWNMPSMSGAELLKKVRASKKHKRVPFLMVTGQAERGSAVQAAESGVDDYILKPFTFEELQTRIERVLRRRFQPSQFEEHVRRGDQCVENGNPEGALNEYGEALGIGPENAVVLHRIGEVYLRKGNLDGASEYFTEALRVKPLFLKALDGLGDIYTRRGMWDKAVQMLLKALELSPNNAERRVNLGVAYLGKGQVNAAKSMFQKAIGFEPENLELMKAVANAYLDHRLYKEAEEIFIVVNRLDPEKSGW